MSIYNREQTYIRLLAQREHTVSELAETLFISQPTVRRDLAVLTQKELVTCHRGRVRLKTRYADQRIPLFIRDMEQTDAKQAIARKAVAHVRDGYVVMLDASTTAYHLLPLLAGFQNLLVITNGAKTALEATAMGIRTICTGGEMTPESFSYVGTDAEAVLRRYNAHVAFFSCRGLSEDGAVTDNSILENAARRIMLDNARESYLLCDKSKHGTRHLNTLCHVKDLAGVISED